MLSFICSFYFCSTSIFSSYQWGQNVVPQIEGIPYQWKSPLGWLIAQSLCGAHFIKEKSFSNKMIKIALVFHQYMWLYNHRYTLLACARLHHTLAFWAKLVFIVPSFNTQDFTPMPWAHLKYTHPSIGDPGLLPSDIKLHPDWLLFRSV